MAVLITEVLHCQFQRQRCLCIHRKKMTQPSLQAINSVGYVIFNATNMSPPPKNGSGTLAVVTFHVEGVGTTILDLDDTANKIVDKDGQSLPLTPSNDGLFRNVKGAKLYVD